VIVGVDHIAVASRDIECDGRILSSLGLIRRFEHRGLLNAPQKRQLLADYRGEHDVAVYDGSSGVALELTGHGSVSAPTERLGFVPVLGMPERLVCQLRGASSIPKQSDVRGVADVLVAAFGVPVSWLDLPELGCGIWATCHDGAPHGVVGAACCVPDAAKSREVFGKGLGAKLSASGEINGRSWFAMEFSSLVPRWRLRLLIYQGLSSGECKGLSLDSAGFPCIAFLSTDITRDVSVFAAAAQCDMPEIFSLRVNEKLLDVAIMRGPGGELIELIQVRRN
jgi:hypothetical protein